MTGRRSSTPPARRRVCVAVRQPAPRGAARRRGAPRNSAARTRILVASDIAASNDAVRESLGDIASALAAQAEVGVRAHEAALAARDAAAAAAADVVIVMRMQLAGSSATAEPASALERNSASTLQATVAAQVDARLREALATTLAPLVDKIAALQTSVSEATARANAAEAAAAAAKASPAHDRAHSHGHGSHRGQDHSHSHGHGHGHGHAQTHAAAAAPLSEEERAVALTRGEAALGNLARDLAALNVSMRSTAAAPARAVAAAARAPAPPLRWKPARELEPEPAPAAAQPFVLRAGPMLPMPAYLQAAPFVLPAAPRTPFVGELRADAFRAQAAAGGYAAAPTTASADTTHAAAPAAAVAPAPAAQAPSLPLRPPAVLPGFVAPPAPAAGAIDSFLYTLRSGLTLRLAQAPVGAQLPPLAPAAVILDTTDILVPMLRWTDAAGAEFCLPFASIRGVQDGMVPATAHAIARAHHCLTVAAAATLRRGAPAHAPDAPLQLLLVECEDVEEAAFISACLWDLACDPAKVALSLELFEQHERPAAQG